jgi:geranylgeranyl diphosphate synthase, type I
MKTITEVIASVGEVPSDFESYLNTFAQPVGDIINSYIEEGNHRDISRYLYQPLLEYSQNGGKRHRPLICYAACAAVGGDLERVTRAAAAIEHFHTAALIHDDIADDAKTRRGLPCMHLSYGEGLAINVGDLALSLVNGLVMNDPLLDDSLRIRIVRELIKMTQYTVEGQAMDIGWARDGRFDITPEDYLFMAVRKTAHYSGGVPLAIGAIIGGADDDTVEGMRQYGLDTGLAFQIQDDLLNLIGTEEATRKDFRSDITEGKRTLIVVHALQNSTPSSRARLVEILSSKEEDPAILAEAVELMEKSGSIDYAREFALELTRKAKENLVEFLPSSAQRDILLSMADWFVSRLQ